MASSEAFRQSHDPGSTTVMAFGNNAYGQLGCGVSEDDEDKVFEPCPIAAFEGLGIISAVCSLKHSAWLTYDGVVYTAGDNDAGQLGRSGKRTRPFKVDAIEHLPIEDIAVGDGYTILTARLDGRLLGVGRGDRGQLGMGGADRENKEKVKFSSALCDEQLLALSAGESHSVALCRSGRVLSFGENRYGQLGLGDFVSTATPKPVPALQCRPVVHICCGGAHTMARTATGLLWAWGCNEHGQLGLGDQKPRFRPEQVKALRVSRCIDVACGNRHTLAVSEKGLLFAFGAGGSGQLGSGGIAEAEPYPRVVDALKEVGRCLLAACGHSHSAALVWNEESLLESLYVWGLGSSGQLGLPRDTLQERNIALLPQRLRLDARTRVVQIAAGPLAHHTFLLLAPVAQTGTNTHVPAPAQRHSLRTAIDADDLLGTLRSLIGHSQADSPQMKVLTKAVGSAFSSVSVLNASFKNSSSSPSFSWCPLGPTESSSSVDLLKVRRAYSTLVFELKSPELVAILGRATLSICDELSKQRVPTDDPENLCVFLVLFENPLLLSEHRTSLFPGFHLALQRLTSAVLSLPKDSQRLLFGWLKHLPSEYFGRVVNVMQQYVTFTLTQPGQNRTDASAAVMILETLWEVNCEMSGILPERCFHNSAISQSDELQEHYRQWQQQQSLVFSYCKYPFLLDANAKRRLLSFDAQMCMMSCMQELVALSLREALQADLESLLRFRVRRSHLLKDFCGQLLWRLRNHPQSLRVSLSVVFEGELGIDAGGLRKECLQLVLRQLCENTSLFMELEELPGLLWFRPNGCERNQMEVDDENDEDEAFMAGFHDPTWKQHLLEIAGAIVGLAAFNGIYLDLRLHPLIYRFLAIRNLTTTFEDLAAMHPTLYRSLGSLRTTDVRNLELCWNVRLPGSTADFNIAPPSNEAVIVQPDNVETFIHAYAEAALTGAVRGELQSFTEKAVYCMAVGSAYSLCTANDLELMICGLPDLETSRNLRTAASTAATLLKALL